MEPYGRSDESCILVRYGLTNTPSQDVGWSQGHNMVNRLEVITYISGSFFPMNDGGMVFGGVIGFIVCTFIPKNVKLLLCLTIA